MEINLFLVYNHDKIIEVTKISRISRKSADSKNMNRSDLSAIHKQILTNMDIGVEYSTEQIAEKIY